MNTIQQWQTKFSKGKMPFVITHGDAHHYNVLQTPYEVWLVDWDGLKIAPIERDLWHYQEAPLVDEYCKLNPHYKINHNLCEFYKLQRFFEDSRYYLEQVLLGKNSTQEQSEQDKKCFVTHWGWSVCLTHLQ
ncbi:phosphotransferase family protein [Legionella worsleiensis]|nr:aminoglycoside phosphotransferase family protein [Legionella worsleiensis]